MVFRKALDEEVGLLTDISKAAFETDIFVGAAGNGGPPGYDSYEWYKKMQSGDHLFSFADKDKIIGGAVLFVKKSILFVGRIFICPEFFRQGYGRKLMKKIEDFFPDVKIIRLDTPIWNTRTNNFYPKCGYVETSRDNETVYYEKRLSP
jgi:GNAT superfamily N-acetyltransferase